MPSEELMGLVLFKDWGSLSYKEFDCYDCCLKFMDQEIHALEKTKYKPNGEGGCFEVRSVVKVIRKKKHVIDSKICPKLLFNLFSFLFIYFYFCLIYLFLIYRTFG